MNLYYWVSFDIGCLFTLWTWELIVRNSRILKLYCFWSYLILMKWTWYCRWGVGCTLRRKQIGLVPFWKVSSLVLALITKTSGKMKKMHSASTVVLSFVGIVRLIASTGGFRSANMYIKMSFAFKKCRSIWTVPKFRFSLCSFPFSFQAFTVMVTNSV